LREYQRVVPNSDDCDIPAEGMDLEAYLDGIEKKILLKALERSGGVKKKAAKFWGDFRSMRYSWRSSGWMR
jgi:two-component system response regulator PilR (NtrC family)